MEQLPVKTFRIKKQKTIGMHIMLVLHLLVVIAAFYFSAGFIPGPRKFFLMLFGLVGIGGWFFFLYGIINLHRENFIGFFISKRGMNDISTGHNYGVIRWEDITNIKIVPDAESKKRNYIAVKLRNPEKYIAREPSNIKKRSMVLKLHYYGTPVCFSNRGLDCSFEELEEAVMQYFKVYSKKSL
ncbi:MAG: hypothetical protein LBQ60_10995 [Bacteroidales bacterium]|jgi:hypothetical protein|nr:hypothetical protein [Bacteroidales bacterium]